MKIAQQCLTYSKRRDQYLDCQPDKITVGGFDRVGTNQGFKYDFVCGLGANLIGHQNVYSLPTEWEEILVERLGKIFPFERFKIMKTGSDACSAAVRVARAFNKNIIGCGTGYHGWGNTFISEENPGSGCVSESYTKYTDFDSLILGLQTENYSYCIIEPVELDINVQKQLEEIRDICNMKNTVLIFDEVITGFRTPKYSISNFFDIQPDLICLGKALGNGYPISILGGSEKLMENDYFVSGTFFGEVESIKNALETLDYLDEDKLNALWTIGQDFQDRFNEISKRVQLCGIPTRAVWDGPDKYRFWAGMNEMGYLLGKAFFLNFNHVDILDTFIEDSKRVIFEIKQGNYKVDREPIPIFKRTEKG